MNRTRTDAIAVSAVAIVFLIVAVIGFTPRYFGPLFAGDYQPPSPWMHAHVISSLLWLIVFLIQPLLILRKTFDRHRLLGRAALLVAIVTAATGIAVQLDLLPVMQGDAGNLGAFTARFTAGLGIFIPAVAFAVVYRKRTAWHLRLMYLATMSLMPSPFGRILVHYVGMPLDEAGPVIGLINVSLAALLPIYDKMVHGKVERISWIAFIAVFIAGGMVGFLINNQGWVDLLTGQ